MFPAVCYPIQMAGIDRDQPPVRRKPGWPKGRPRKSADGQKLSYKRSPIPRRYLLDDLLQEHRERRRRYRIAARAARKGQTADPPPIPEHILEVEAEELIRAGWGAWPRAFIPADWRIRRPKRAPVIWEYDAV